MIARMLVFGGAGDLGRRLLLPGLAELEARGELPRGLAIVAVGRHEMSTKALREAMTAALREHAPEVDEAAREATVARLSYAQADATSAAEIGALVGDGGPVVAYLALPPAAMEDAVRAFAGAGPPRGSRVVLEKPFGEDLASARSLNRALGERFADDDVFRVDHFLGLRALRTLACRRASDDALDGLLRREHVARVEIVWDETLALEGRADFYDRTGALRDVVQNHLLQVLALVAMERPASAAACDLRRARTAVLGAVSRPRSEEARGRVVRGRYGAGEVDGRAVPAYVDEDGVDAARGTETFVALTLHVDTERWRGVPFVVRTGKALARDRHELCVQLRAGSGAGVDGVAGDVLRLSIEDAPPGGSTLSAYGEVLRAVLAGEPSASVGAAEAEASWQVVEPYMRLFAGDEVPLHTYPAGSAGPEEVR